MRDKPVLVLRTREKEPGPDFDERIAEALDLPKGLPYSTYMGAAWLVAAAMEADYGEFELRHEPVDSVGLDDILVGGYWECEFEDGPPMQAEKVAHAICLAALHNRYQVTDHD